ncbi:DUF305 domain-containing protein [Escherichia coli]|uniref:CopM family metallochaperone n=1 Tax=Escherichia coli TaxID=562 RepID=UPI0002CCC5A5|nr:DUF305 domain-containing protein [Escherichia coli]EFA5184872.1 DUF305 domain-containing protein [Escherichia coli]EFD1588815.1 DUF305 domain-containing protein [Escherichia coli]EIV9393021.1 DUF305 domain-containing protein [Escherichia coli]EJI1711969.1 DUF305 domain-containing protein [Escherichia coli]EMW69072.1 hypothetical protein EC2747800_5061 [Escherichia coli 2747800]
MKTFLISGALLFSSVALAEPHHAHATSNQPATMTEAGQAYMNGMQSMHDGMMKGIMAADADEAFVRGMIAHHQGAVDMAKIQLKYGKDAEMRQLAEDIIKAQEQEIKQMQSWLEKKASQNAKP